MHVYATANCLQPACKGVAKWCIYQWQTARLVSSQTCHTATGTHMPHGITQCHLPPGRGDIPAFMACMQTTEEHSTPGRGDIPAFTACMQTTEEHSTYKCVCVRDRWTWNAGRVKWVQLAALWRWISRCIFPPVTPTTWCRRLFWVANRPSTKVRSRSSSKWASCYFSDTFAFRNFYSLCSWCGWFFLYIFTSLVSFFFFVHLLWKTAVIQLFTEYL